MADPTETPASFFGFLNLPSELRNGIYELMLVHQEPIIPRFGFFRPRLTLGLLRASKAIHHEASSVLYGRNRFHFSNCGPEVLASFLEQIGTSNAAYIRRVSIDFPDFLRLSLGRVTLVEDSVGLLGTIQSSCTNLSTLETSLGSTSRAVHRLKYLGNQDVATEALQLVDARFRAISSLRDIILEVHEGDLSDHIRQIMKSHGWTITTSEYVEDEDKDGDDLIPDDFDYDDYGYDDYDYDDDGDGSDGSDDDD
ncbi:hypothetical protein F5B21DRAFT_518605 [Xylaria acuta]|nr:hypothetical protein F5B21DRAFT_518605 [Xylaria acuta]